MVFAFLRGGGRVFRGCTIARFPVFYQRCPVVGTEGLIQEDGYRGHAAHRCQQLAHPEAA